MIVIITGSGYEQNQSFIHEYRLSEACAANPTCASAPCVLLAENGAIEINVTDGLFRLAAAVPTEEAATLRTRFRAELLRYVDENLLAKYGLAWSHVYADQDSKLYLPLKETMLTVNIPRSHAGRHGYRDTPEAERLRAELLKAMMVAADVVGLEYRVL